MPRRTIHDGVFTSLYMSLLLGIFPTYIGKTGKKKVVKTSRYCNYVPVAYFLFYTFILGLASLEKNPVLEGKMYNFNTLAKLLILVVTVVGVVTTYVVFYLGYLFKDYLRDFINTVAGIDKTLTRRGYKFNYRATFFVDLIISCGGPLFILSNLTMEVWNIPRENMVPIPPVLLLGHIFPFVLVHHGESQFFLCNMILHKRFSIVNLMLQKLNQKFLEEKKYMSRKKIGTISDMIRDGKSDEKILMCCMRCHDQLCDLCDVVNKIFGFLLITGCLVQFNTIVFAFCYCYYSIATRPISTLGWFFWTLLRIYELARKSLAGHITSREVQSTVQWVNKLMIHSNAHIEEKLRIFVLQLTHRKITFTALGLFPLNGSFAFTVIGAATTYITIIYQFQVSKPSC